ncbi:MAG: hypothetical protein QM541_10945 [Flavobacterium sp.]|nr:hypothetical protein [Flavobacterium sp.]
MQNQQVVPQAKMKVKPMVIGKKLAETSVLTNFNQNGVINTRLKEGNCHNK